METTEVNCPRVWHYVASVAKQVFRLDEAKVTECVTLAWYSLRKATELPPLGLFSARICYKVMRGRGLPGANLAGQREAMNRLKRVFGGGAGHFTRRKPEPPDLIHSRERWNRILAALTDKQRACAELLAGDWNARTDATAEALGVSPGRVSQMRREIMDVADRFE